MARTSKGTAVKTTPKKARKPTAPNTAKTAAKLAKRAGTGKEKGRRRLENSIPVRSAGSSCRLMRRVAALKHVTSSAVESR